jgi:hypothetical protein
MRSGNPFDLPGRNVLTLAADAIRHAAEENDITLVIGDAKIAGMERSRRMRGSR